MRIVVSDSSCLIDLRKASLLEAFLRLPYELLIPNTLFEEELLEFSAAQKKALLRGGLKVVDLPGERVLRDREIARELPHLSVHDGFACALAESCSDCILLTGDRRLRRFARKQGIVVHGVLWVMDELHTHEITTAATLLAALRVLNGDPTVRLPPHELAAYVKRYGESCVYAVERTSQPAGPQRIARDAEDYPETLRSRLGENAPAELTVLGDASLLRARRTALFCSARTPGDAILRTHDAARRMRDDGVTVISGFHSPIEQECLRILLRGKQPLIICPARAIEAMRVPMEARAAFDAGRVLLVSPFSATPKRVTKESAARRNDVVAALADEAYIAHREPGGGTARIAQMLELWNVRRSERA